MKKKNLSFFPGTIDRVSDMASYMASSKSDDSSAWTSVPSSVPSDTSWDRHFKKPKVENGWGQQPQVDKEWGQWPQVEKERPREDNRWRQDKGLGQDKGWGQNQRVDNGWQRRPLRLSPSPLNGWDDPPQTIDVALTLQEMKNRPPKDHGTCSYAPHSWQRVDKGWGQRPQVDTGRGQDKEWGQHQQRLLSLYGRDDPLHTIDDELAFQELKNSSPNDHGTLSNDLQALQTNMATEDKNMVTEKGFKIKLLIDSKAKRVLFAEAEKELVDFLFSLLALPLGSITEIITKKNMVGSTGNLYESVENFSSSYLQPNLDKNSLLKPKVVLSAGSIHLLPPSVGLTGGKYYRCNTTSHHCYVTNLPGTKCPCCSSEMTTEMSFVAGGYVKGGLVMYLVTDELVVMPISTMSCITLLKKFNVVDLSFLEEKIVDFGMKEGLEVLKASFQSRTVLTEVFLGKKSDTLQSPQTTMATENTTMVTEKVLSIKLLIDSKAKRVVFAEAEKELVDFLFSLLALPVAFIIELVSKKSMVGSLGNLFESVENISSTYVQPNLDKNSLLRPKVVLSARNIPLLPPSGWQTSTKYYMCSTSFRHSYVTDLPGTRCPSCPSGNYQMSTEMSYVADSNSDISSKNVGYVRGGLVTYLVTDDLVVMPMSSISSITLLKKFNVVDVSLLEEKIVDFGIKEGLEVLKAALQSKTVLTEVFLGKKIKPEMQ